MVVLVELEPLYQYKEKSFKNGVDKLWYPTRPTVPDFSHNFNIMDQALPTKYDIFHETSHSNNDKNFPSQRSVDGLNRELRKLYSNARWCGMW